MFTFKAYSRTFVKSFINRSPKIHENSASLQQSEVIRCALKIFYKNLHRSQAVNATISYKLSDIGEGIRDVVIKEWYVQVGDKVAQFDNICEVQSDKASVTITSRYDGVIRKLHHSIDETALVGQPLVDIEVDNGKEHVQANDENPNVKSIPFEAPKDILKQPAPISDEEYKLCIPSVRRMAKQHNINLSDVIGTGKHGRVMKEDLLRYITSKEATSQKQSTIDSGETAQDYTEPIVGFKKVMFKAMTDSLKIPHFLYCEELYVTQLSQLRRLIKNAVEQDDIKPSFLPFFIKATSNALLKYPILNSTVDKNGENIIFKAAHNIGVAMDTAEGLAVPVIKNVQNLNVINITKELNRLQLSGKRGTFAPDDLNEGTFTISNIGNIGGTYAAPIILAPQVAIIALGRSKVVPLYRDDNTLKPEEILSLSASGDHRILDGATMAKFISLIKRQIESPYLLFLNI